MPGIVEYPTPVQPRQVRLELTNFCNAHCRPCHGHGDFPMTRPKGYMAQELLEKCLADIQTFPEALTEVVPSNWGETFLAPGWPELLQLIAKKLPRTQMVVPTNGTLLTDGAVADLCRVPTLRLVNISVNAFTPETYEAFHTLPASNLKRIKQAAERLRELRPDLTIWVSLVSCPGLQSPKEIELFQQFWARYGIVQINRVEYAGVPGKEPMIPVILPCRSIFSDIAVCWDGRVSSCCYDANAHIILGDASKENLIDIWHGKVFQDLRNQHNLEKRSEIPLCRECTFA